MKEKLRKCSFPQSNFENTSEIYCNNVVFWGSSFKNEYFLKNGKNSLKTNLKKIEFWENKEIRKNEKNNRKQFEKIFLKVNKNNEKINKKKIQK